MIPAGSILSYQAKGRSGYFQGEGDLVQEMNIEFAQANITMRDYHSSWTSVLGAVDAYLGGPSDFQFTATLQTNADFNSVQDVASIADHAIFQVTGTLPTSTVPNLTVPSGGTSMTGQPDQNKNADGTPKIHKCGDSSWGFLDDPGQYIACLGQGATNTFALLMAGVILAVVLIIAGKHKAII